MFFNKKNILTVYKLISFLYGYSDRVIHFNDLNFSVIFSLFNQPSFPPGDIDATVTIVLGRQPRPNEADSLKCEELDVSFHVGYASMKLENLFGGDGDLSTYTIYFCFLKSWFTLSGSEIDLLCNHFDNTDTSRNPAGIWGIMVIVIMEKQDAP